MAPIRAAVFAGLIGAVGSAVAIALQPILSKLRRRQILLRRLAGRETTHKLKNENGMEVPPHSTPPPRPSASSSDFSCRLVLREAACSFSPERVTRTAPIPGL